MASGKWQAVRDKWSWVLRFVLVFVGVLSAERVLFEAVFPRWTWLGLPLVALAISLLTTVALTYILAPIKPLHLAPLLLNLLWLLDPAVDLIHSRWLLGLSIWLVLLFTTRPQRNRLLMAVYCALPLLLLYWATLGRDVGSADTFEFQVTAPQMGIAHPTGYPLYLLLGKLWTLIVPVQSVAMRLNIGTAIYALIASVLVAKIVADVVRRPAVGIVTGVVFGVRTTFWSQAVAAEVYTLHAVIVAGALWLLWRQVQRGVETATLSQEARLSVLQRYWCLVAFWLGLGMTNHVTTVLLLPATIFLYLTIQHRQTVDHSLFTVYCKPLPKIILAALLPLLLYLYLPLRWQAVNREAMGFGRFLQWITGSRFAGALQLRAWLDDGARWGIIGRFFLQEWGWFGLILVAIGFCYLLFRQRNFAIALLLTWAAFSFYCLNYYVPDLNVFLLPAHLTMAIALGGFVPALQFVVGKIASRLPFNLTESEHGNDGGWGLSYVLLLPLLLGVATTYRQVDQSAPNELTVWATGVLRSPLAENAAILADSDKFPPLYYLQQAEGMRPDLEIMVLPDEATYRTELDQRVAQGQTVYLARFLPRLPYAMRATTPLVEIVPEQALVDVESAESTYSKSGIGLIAAQLTLDSTYGREMASLALTWRRVADEAAPSQFVYLRWQGDGWATTPTSQHPVNNSYPTAAWTMDEVVDDFYLLEKPLVAMRQSVDVQIALGEAFLSADSLTWHTLETVTLSPQTDRALSSPVRIWQNGQAVSSVAVNSDARPEKPFSIFLNALTTQPSAWQIGLPDGTQLTDGCFGNCTTQNTLPQDSYTWEQRATLADAGTYALFVKPADGDVRCGWFSRVRERCEIGRITISGVALPEGAINFGDQIGLLSAEVPTTQLIPNGLFDVTLNWQSLSQMTEDYTVFVQVLDANDTIVGQVDNWPVQGTYPTSQWQVGEIVRDPYRVHLAPDLASGDYRLVVGFYRLRDLRRLPVIDENGASIEDRFIVPNLFVP